MQNAKSLDSSRIAQDLQIRKIQVESVVELLDEGNTIPFIARYRRERTGGLNEELIRQIQLRARSQRQLADRKQTILRSIENQGRLTDHLRQAIGQADTTKRLEDLYLPFKPKKRSTASAAKEKGLEPLAVAIWNRDPAVSNLAEVLPTMVNPERGLATVDDVRAGVLHILAEMVGDTADVRAAARFSVWETGQMLATKNEKVPPNKGGIFKNYFSFSEPLRKIPPHRILALNRGERESILKVRIEWDKNLVQTKALAALADACLRQAETGQLAQATFVPSAAPAPVDQPTPPPGASEPSSETAAGATGDAGAETPPVTDSAGMASVAEAPPALEATTTATPEMNIPVPHEQAAAQEAPVQAPGVPESPPTMEPAPQAPPAPGSATPVVAESAPIASPQAAESAPAPIPVANEGGELSPGSAYRTPHSEIMRQALDEALNRIVGPSIEREVRRELMDEAEIHAISVFAHNLRNLLTQRPLHQRRVLAVDPGFKTGCRLAALDEKGNLLEQATIHPHPAKIKSRPGADKASAEAAKPGETSAAPADPALGGGSPAPNVVPQPEAPATGAAPEPSPAPEGATQSPAPTEVAPQPTAAEGPAAAPATSSETPPAEGAPAATPAGSAEAPAAVPAVDQRALAKSTVEELVNKYNIDVVAIGNGTGCRETEEFIAEIINEKLPRLSYVVVNEAGASVYANAVGREEFPDLDATLRATLSIGRRLQDPLAELVKIDPPHLGVGLYQHDINPKHLKDSLESVVESCVNQVGVEVNAANLSLLRHVAGLNHLVAREIVEHRKAHGLFRTRDQLQQVPGMGQPRYIQSAGFLRVAGGENPLDMTWIHPESYGITTQMIAQLGYGPDVIHDAGRRDAFHAKLKALSPAELSAQLQTTEPTIRDIIEELLHPGRDPREDLPLPIFRKGILKLEDLQVGMELRGTVLNVVDFGAFVDVGLKDSGLVHISQLANRFVKNPFEVVAVGDVVTVWVIKVDLEQRLVSLSMIRPGAGKRPGRPDRGRPDRGRPERGERPEAAAAGAPGGAPATDRPPHRGQRPGGPPRGGPPRQGGPGRPPRQGGPGRPGGPPPGRGGPPRPAHAGPHGRPGGGPGADPRDAATGDKRPVGPPPRRPHRDMPRPKLSKEALEGKEALRTFSELSAFFAAKKEPADQHAPGKNLPAEQAGEGTAMAPPSGIEAAVPAPVAEATAAPEQAPAPPESHPMPSAQEESHNHSSEPSAPVPPSEAAAPAETKPAE